MESTATSSEEEEKFSPKVQLESINHEAVDSEPIIQIDGHEAAAPEGDSDRLTEMSDDDQR